MPNHVYNTVSFTGSYEELSKIKKFLGMEHQINELEYQYRKNSVNSFESTDAKTLPIFNYFNLLAPDKKDWDQYVEERSGGNQPFPFWYSWNVTNWGTKWGAYDVNLDHPFDEQTKDDDVLTMTYNFNSAWSPPTGIIYALGEYLKNNFPHVESTWEWEEEQGFGEELNFEDGEYLCIREWDSPNCHADYVDRDNVEGCICSWEEDQDNWYNDCPRLVEKETNE